MRAAPFPSCRIAGRAARAVGLKHKPGELAPEDRMTTASARVGQVLVGLNSYHRLESGLEADLMTVIMAWAAEGHVTGFQAQYGPLKYYRGIDRGHIRPPHVYA